LFGNPIFGNDVKDGAERALDENDNATAEEH
jgi:hypothetical protein